MSSPVRQLQPIDLSGSKTTIRDEAATTKVVVVATATATVAE